ncbi:MAG: integrin alpha [Desulfobacterales bacterium]|jgi:hypothetical protein
MGDVMGRDGKVKGQQKIGHTESNFAGVLNDGDKFGISISSMGDMNDDGISDLAAGRFDKPGTGIAFVLPVDQASGLENKMESFKKCQLDEKVSETGKDRNK